MKNPETETTTKKLKNPMTPLPPVVIVEMDTKTSLDRLEVNLLRGIFVQIREANEINPLTF